MADSNALRQAALKELARRELARRQGQPAPAPAEDPELTGYVTGDPMSAAPTSDFRAPPPDPNAPPAPLGPVKSLQYGTQSVGSGIANALGAPVDIATLALNAGIAIPNIFGADLPTIENPIGGSQSIKDAAAAVAQALFGEQAVIQPEQVPATQRIAGSAVDFGTQALLPGAALAAKAGQVSTMAKPASMVTAAPSNPAQSVVNSMSQPYVANAGRTLSGDVVAAGGAGAAVQSYDEYAPDPLQETLGPIGPLIAALVGGTGAATGKAIVEGAGAAGVNTAKGLVGGNYDPRIPMDEVTGYRPTNAELDQAAMIAQGQASNPLLAARTIEEEAAALRAIEPRVAIPTSGALSGDVGLNLYENTKRVADAAPFIRRTQAVNTGANDLISRSAPADADPRALTEFADRTVADRLRATNDIGERALAMEAQLTARDRAALEAQRPVSQDAGRVAAARGQGPEASRRIDEAFRTNYREARDTKNALYNDPTMVNAPVDAQELYDAVESIQAASSGPLSIGGGLPGEIVDRVRALVVARNEDTGVPEAFRDITYGDVQDLRAAVSEQIQLATQGSANGASGSGPRVQALRDLREVLDGFPDQLADAGNEAARAAIENYATNYRPRFREGQAGNLARDITRDPTGTRVRPEDTAGKFLGNNKGSDVESLNRAVPNNAADARIWLLDKLAATGVVDEQSNLLRPDRLRTWAQSNAEVINRVPGMRADVDRMLAEAQQGQEITGRIADEVRQLDQNSRVAQARIGMDVQSRTKQIEGSTLSKIRGKSPDNAVAAVFKSGDAEKAMDDLVLETGPDKKAQAGLKAAVRDWLIDRTSTTAVEKTIDGERPTSFAQLENLFNKHEKALAKVYSPEEMNALRDAHRLLKPMNNLRNRGTTGSDTAEKGAMGWKVLEAGLKARYGVLKGGGLLRTIRIAAETLPNSRDGIDQLTKRMFFDPDLAVFLLRREIKPDSPEWNAKLQRLIGFAAAGRESGEPD